MLFWWVLQNLFLTFWWCAFTEQPQQKLIKTAPFTVNSVFVPLHPWKPIDTKADVTKCAFWEYEPDSLQGHWATHGCKTIHVTSHATTCSCNHLTHFAILMSSGRANVSERTFKSTTMTVQRHSCVVVVFLHFFKIALVKQFLGGKRWTNGDQISLWHWQELRL